MHFTFYKVHLNFFFVACVLIALMSSCSVLKSTRVKNYPVNKPFVFANKITLKGNIRKDEKTRLSSELDNYWDDSLKVRMLQQFGIIYVLKTPPVFDSANIGRSINFMNAYLNSQGYYYASFIDSVRVDTVKDQLRASISMTINIGKNITIDSVSYNLGDTVLQKLTTDQQKNTLLKKGTPYTKQRISDELDRLVGLYRNNGYYKFTREDIYALNDTTDPRLLQLTLDPFKQAQIIADADRIRRENPTWHVTILKRPTFDSSRLTQYHIGHTYYYPETRNSDILDSMRFQKNFNEFNRRNLTMRYRRNLFNYRVLREHTYLRNGELYNEDSYYKTINTLGQIGAWQEVDGRPVPRGKDSLDMYFYLIPAIKQDYSIDLEGSKNTADIGLGNLFGISTNLTYHNKNVWKGAIQSLATFRTGVELNLFTTNTDPLLQTFLINLGHTYVFPNLVQPFKNWRALNKLDNKRTLFNVNGSYVDRRGYYQVRSLVTSWGYEFKKGNNVWFYKPFNLELYAIDTLAGLDTLFKTNPFLRASFYSGKVLSQSLSFIKNFNSLNNSRKSHYIRMGIEQSGGIYELIPGIKNDIYRYIKLEAEYKQTVKYQKSELGYRVFAGVGYNYGSDTLRDKTLPFFKQFSAGGPYSMRAWGLRQLGLGSSLTSEADTAQNSYRDRFGDMQLEANIEYRFPLFSIGSLKFGSALFTDIGNVWNIKPNAADPDAQFKLKNLMRDLAIGVGTGLRMDFSSYFLIRLDWAYKVKDPARQYNNGWMENFNLHEYRANGLRVSNYAFQLGIGLPF